MKARIATLLKGKDPLVFSSAELASKAKYRRQRKQPLDAAALYGAAASRDREAPSAGTIYDALEALCLSEAGHVDAPARLKAVTARDWSSPHLASELGLLESVYGRRLISAGLDREAFETLFEQAVATSVVVFRDFPWTLDVQLLLSERAIALGSLKTSARLHRMVRRGRSSRRAKAQLQCFAQFEKAQRGEQLFFVSGQPIPSAFWALIDECRPSKAKLAQRLWRLPKQSLIAFAAYAFEAADLVRPAYEGPFIQTLDSHLSEDSTKDLTGYITCLGKETWESTVRGPASDAELEVFFHRRQTERPWVGLAGLSFVVYTARYGDTFHDDLDTVFDRGTSGLFTSPLPDPLAFWPIIELARRDFSAFEAALETMNRGTLGRFHHNCRVLSQNLLGWRDHAQRQTLAPQAALDAACHRAVAQGREFYRELLADSAWLDGSHPWLSECPPSSDLLKRVESATNYGDQQTESDDGCFW